jgi:hypothetical protein
VIGIFSIAAWTIKIVAYPSSWQLLSARGIALCVVYRGWSGRQVADVCGEAELTGWQPKVGTDGPQWFCSAPCEVHGRSLVLYDCEEKVYASQLASGPWRCDAQTAAAARTTH